MNTKAKTNVAEESTIEQKPFVPKVVKHVTLPLLKMNDNETYYLKFLTAFKQDPKDLEAYKAAKAAWKEGDKALMETPHLAQVMNLETGELHTYIGTAVLLSNFEKFYENESYVGKGFALKVSKPEGKRKYSLFDITEIEV